MSYNADGFKEEVRRHNDIVEVIGAHVELKQAGQNYIGLCPFHNERTPSFTVSRERQMYYCFGCQVGGDVFHFVMEREQVDFRQALQALADRAGLEMPATEMSPAARRLARQKAQLREVLAAAALWYQRALRSGGGTAARQYLQARGMTGEMARDFQIGWSPDEWQALTDSLGERFNPELLAQAGLAAPRRQGQGFYDRFRGRVMFPISNDRGEIIGFGGRLLAEAAGSATGEQVHQAKYLNSPETPVFKKRQTLYATHMALPAIRRQGRVLVVEGYTDAITCHQYGFDFAVASLGTALSAEQAHWLARPKGTVYIAYDADGAGQQATLRGLEHFRQLGQLDVRVVDLPAGSDPDDFLRQHGADAFQELLDQAQPLLDWRFDLACQRHDTDTVTGKVAVVDEMAPLLAAVKHKVARDAYVANFARRLQVSQQSLGHEINKAQQRARQEEAQRRARQAGGRRWVRQAEGGQRRQTPVGQGAFSRGEHKTKATRDNNSAGTGRTAQRRKMRRLQRYSPAEAELLRLLLHMPSMAGYVWQQISPDQFNVPEYRSIARQLAKASDQFSENTAGNEKEERKTLGHIVMEGVVNEAARQVLASLLVEDWQLVGQPEELVQQLVQALHRDGLNQQWRAVTAEIKRLEEAGEEVPVGIVRLNDELGRRYCALRDQVRLGQGAGAGQGQ